MTICFNPNHMYTLFFFNSDTKLESIQADGVYAQVCRNQRIYIITKRHLGVVYIWLVSAKLIRFQQNAHAGMVWHSSTKLPKKKKPQQQQQQQKKNRHICSLITAHDNGVFNSHVRSVCHSSSSSSTSPGAGAQSNSFSST